MEDITNEGISSLEDLFKRRDPMTSMDAYFNRSFKGKNEQEYLAIDGQGFVTDHRWLWENYGESTVNDHNFSLCLNMMAIGIAMVFFASMREQLYRATKSSSSATPEDSSCDLVPSKLAIDVWNLISKYKTTIPDFPQKEACDLLIVGRSIDLIAPEWIYDAMIWFNIRDYSREED